MPIRFKAPKQKIAKPVAELPVHDPEKMDEEVHEILEVIKHSLDDFQSKCMEILSNPTYTADIIAELALQENDPKVAEKCGLICHSQNGFVNNKGLIRDIFDDRGTILEGAELKYRRQLFQLQCKHIRQFMEDMKNYLNTAKDIIHEFRRVQEIVSHYRKNMELIFTTSDLQIGSVVPMHMPSRDLVTKILYEIVYSSIHSRLVECLCDEFDKMRNERVVNYSHISAMDILRLSCVEIQWLNPRNKYFGKDNGVSLKLCEDYFKHLTDRLS